MTPAHRDVLTYLIPRRESFWRWTPDALGVEWKDGRTLAFRREVAEVLAHLAPGGLPRLDAVLVLLAACRDNWQAVDNAGRMLLAYSGAVERDLPAAAAAAATPAGLIVASVIPARVRSELGSVVEDLDAISELPAELRQGVRAKCVLAETVFEGAKRPVPPPGALAIVRALSEGLDPEPLRHAARADDAYRDLVDEIDSLRRGLARVDAEQLRLRQRTGLDAPVVPAAVELPPPDARSFRALLTELRDDPELAGVTRVARNLLAAIHVPRALAAPQDLPVGGVSDLANRGPLDRLLVSELAHDDLTLTTRIALNEALYVRREAPSSTPPHDRVILLDSGIRLWGLPRLFATAVALALAASSEKGARVRCFRPTANAAQPADLATRGGLIAQLESLEPAPHPGAAVRAVLQSLSAGTAAAAADLDVMLVTHDDVATDPDFVRVLNEVDPARAWHVATVNRAGDFRLQQLGRAGRRTLCSAKLSLDDLLAPAPRKGPRSAPLVDDRADAALPAILFADPFPLLLPARADARRAAVSESLGLLSVTRDGRLLRWTDERKGAAQLSAAAPRGTPVALLVDEDAGVVCYVSHDTPVRKPAQTNVLVGSPAQSRWAVASVDATGALRAAAHHGGVLLLLYDRRVVALDALGNTVADRAVAAGAWHWHCGRYYRAGGVAYAAHFDGHDVEFQQLSNVLAPAFFDRKGFGPWQVRRDGQVCGVGAPPQLARMPRSHRTLSQFHFSADGHRILARAYHPERGQPARWEGYFLDLQGPYVWRPVPPGAHHLLVGKEFGRAASGMNVNKRFHAIYAGDAGDLVLLNARRQAIRLNPAGHLRLQPAGLADGRSSATVHFGRPRRRPGARFTLRSATWPDGSRAFLDSRGMLHLKPADRALPEISLVLSDANLSGWTSEGQTFGWAYFHADAPSVQPDYVHALLRQFTARLR